MEKEAGNAQFKKIDANPITLLHASNCNNSFSMTERAKMSRTKKTFLRFLFLYFSFDVRKGRLNIQKRQIGAVVVAQLAERSTSNAKSPQFESSHWLNFYNDQVYC